MTATEAHTARLARMHHTQIQGIKLTLGQIARALREIKHCRCKGTQAFREPVFDRVLEGK